MKASIVKCLIVAVLAVSTSARPHIKSLVRRKSGVDTSPSTCGTNTVMINPSNPDAAANCKCTNSNGYLQHFPSGYVQNQPSGRSYYICMSCNAGYVGDGATCRPCSGAECTNGDILTCGAGAKRDPNDPKSCVCEDPFGMNMGFNAPLSGMTCLRCNPAAVGSLGSCSWCNGVGQQMDTPNNRCTCRSGFLGDGKTCNPDLTCPLTGQEINATGDGCKCKTGFVGDGYNCISCSLPNQELDQANNKCKCKAGFVGDGWTCVDCSGFGQKIDQANNRCVCKDGFNGDGQTCYATICGANSKTGGNRGCQCTDPNADLSMISASQLGLPNPDQTIYYTCVTCSFGYSGDPATGCSDCTNNPSTCYNFNPMTCATGAKAAPNNPYQCVCSDPNAMLATGFTDMGDMVSTCQSCKTGYVGDGKTCISADAAPSCTGTGQELNPAKTACQCKTAFVGDGTTCTDCAGPGQALDKPNNRCKCQDGYTGDGNTCISANAGTTTTTSSGYGTTTMTSSDYGTATTRLSDYGTTTTSSSDAGTTTTTSYYFGTATTMSSYYETATTTSSYAGPATTTSNAGTTTTSIPLNLSQNTPTCETNAESDGNGGCRCKEGYTRGDGQTCTAVSNNTTPQCAGAGQIVGKNGACACLDENAEFVAGSCSCKDSYHIDNNGKCTKVKPPSTPSSNGDGNTSPEQGSSDYNGNTSSGNPSTKPNTGSSSYSDDANCPAVAPFSKAQNKCVCTCANSDYVLSSRTCVCRSGYTKDRYGNCKVTTVAE